MSLINFNTLYTNTLPPYNSRQNDTHNNTYIFNYNSSKHENTYNENLKLRYNKPEISSEENLSEDKLEELKQSPARKRLSVALHECDNKCFSVTDKDAAMLNIIGNSVIVQRFNFCDLFEKMMQSNTQKIVSVIQGINQLDTGNMTESEMEAKADEFTKIVNQEKSKMETIRELLAEGVELAKQYEKTDDSKEKAQLDASIKQFGNKFTAFAQNATAENTDSSSDI